MKIDENLSEKILFELKKISKLISLSITKDESQKQQIILLNSAGLSPKEIAELINTTSNNVSVTLNRSKKSKKI